MNSLSNIPNNFDIYGSVDSIVYQQAKILSDFLDNEDNSDNKSNLNPMDPFEFSEFKTKLKQQGRMTNDSQSLIVIMNDNEILDFNDFLKWMTKNTNFKDNFPEEYELKKLAIKEQDKFLVELQKKTSIIVFKHYN